MGTHTGRCRSSPPNEAGEKSPPEEGGEQEQRRHNDKSDFCGVAGGDPQPHAAQHRHEPDHECRPRSVSVIVQKADDKPADDAGNEKRPPGLGDAEYGQCFCVACPSDDGEDEDENEIDDGRQNSDHGGKSIGPRGRH